MKSKRDGFFWVSYTDVMITLFFVMLAIAAISVYQLDEQARTSEEKLRRIEKIQDLVKKLQDQTTEDGKEKLFSFNKDANRFEIKRNITFDQGKFLIVNQSDRDYLIQVGKTIENLVAQAKKSTEGANLQTPGKVVGSASYLIVIEGSASPEGDCVSNYELSYKRAYQLWDLWLNANLKLKVPGFSDVQISGSGSQSPDRVTKPCLQLQDFIEDPSLRRFKIHVVPLIPDVSTIK
jgi:hypothetical protein